MRSLSVALLFALLFYQQLILASPEHSIAELPVQPHRQLGLAFPGADPKHYHSLSEIGMGVVRLTVPWHFREPTAGEYVWAPLDARILRLQQLGISPFLTLVPDAPWAIRPNNGKVMNAMPRDLAVWRNFVAALVERYDHDGKADAPGLLTPLHYYQVANEWVSPYNHAGGWAEADEELIELFRITYEAVKSSDAKAKVVLGGIAAGNLDLMVLSEQRADYQIVQRYNATSSLRVGQTEVRQPIFVAGVERMYQILEKAPYDLVDAHLYGQVSRNSVRLATLRAHIAGRGIIASECGGPSLDYQDDYHPADHFRAVFEWNLSALSEGVDFCLWFGLAEGEGASYGNRHVPLLAQDGTPKPGYLAYRLLAYVLKDMAHIEQLAEGRYLVHRHSQPPLFVGWTDQRKPGQPTSAQTMQLSAAEFSGELTVWQVSDASRGNFTVQQQAAETALTLDKLPLIAGKDFIFEGVR